MLMSQCSGTCGAILAGCEPAQLAPYRTGAKPVPGRTRGVSEQIAVSLYFYLCITDPGLRPCLQCLNDGNKK